MTQPISVRIHTADRDPTKGPMMFFHNYVQPIMDKILSNPEKFEFSRTDIVNGFRAVKNTDNFPLVVQYEPLPNGSKLEIVAQALIEENGVGFTRSVKINVFVEAGHYLYGVDNNKDSIFRRVAYIAESHMYERSVANLNIIKVCLDA